MLQNQQMNHKMFYLYLCLFTQKRYLKPKTIRKLNIRTYLIIIMHLLMENVEKIKCNDVYEFQHFSN